MLAIAVVAVTGTGSAGTIKTKRFRGVPVLAGGGVGAAAAALAAAVVFAVVPGVAWAQEPLPSLTETTTVVGDRAAYVDVELPSELVTGGDQRPSFVLEGEGEYLGFRLRAHAGGCAPTFSMSKLGRANDGAFVYGTGCGTDGTLPAGRYRLYFLSEKPGRVTFRFPSLPEGKTVVTATAPAPFTFRVLPRVSPPLAGYEAFGAMSTLERDGFVFTRVVLNEVPPGTAAEICAYDHRDEPPAQAYGRGCPGGRSAYRPALTPSSYPVELFLYSSGNIAGRYGRGYNIVSPVPGLSYGIAVWFWYVDPRPSDGTTPTEPDSAIGGTNPPDATDPADPPGSDPYGVASLASRRAYVTRRRAAVRLRCSGNAPCRGYAILRRGRRGAKFAITHGGRATVRMPVRRRLARRVRRHGRASAVLSIHSRAASVTRVQTASLNLVRKRRR